MRTFHSILIDLRSRFGNEPWSLNCRRADGPDVDGLWIWMPSGHGTEFGLMTFAKKKLAELPIPWVTVQDAYWLIDVDQARIAFNLKEAWGGSAAWPDWLAGTVEVEPKYESGEGFASRLSLRITRDTYTAAMRRKATVERTAVPATVIQQFYSGVHMDTKYTVTGGQVGAMGDNARAEGNTFNQYWTEAAASLDLGALAAELSGLRASMRKDAVEPEHDQAVACIGAAEVAAKGQDRHAVLKHLKSAGSWAFDTATKIGTTVAAKAIQSAIGLP